MNYVVKAINKVRLIVSSAKKRRSLRSEYERYFALHPNAAFLLLTPEHGNLGDQAIALAETTLLKEIGIDYYEITGKALKSISKARAFSAMNGFPIIMNGGYLGTIWPSSEKTFRNIIEANPDSTIIMLPNTIYYDDSETGRSDFKKSKEVYNAHKSLYLYAREQTSYDIMKDAYANVKLIPDIVLSFVPKCSSVKRSGCVTCLRSDREKTLTDVQAAALNDQISELFGDNVLHSDMISERSSIPVSEREAVLQQKFEQFASAELVITDRLHGMIFAAITNTPCIVLGSMSHKVRGCYEWIKDLDYIRFVDNVSDIAEAFRSIPNTEHKFDNSHLAHYYDELKQDLKQLILGE